MRRPRRVAFGDFETVDGNTRHSEGTASMGIGTAMLIGAVTTWVRVQRDSVARNRCDTASEVAECFAGERFSVVAVPNADAVSRRDV